jgi:cell division protein FtsB
MAIASVMQGTVELESGKVIELDSPSGAKWLESVVSFRYEPTGASKPYTVRKEASGYWYGYRKVAGKLHKRYVGKASELSTAKLEEIAEALNVPPQPRVTETVTEKAEVVTQTVTGTVTEERISVLELQVQSLQKALEALQKALLGKSESGNSEELPTVADNELHIELGNLRDENEALRQENEALKAENAQLKTDTHLPDLKAVYEIYKKEKKPGRTFTLTELKPFYAAMLKLLTPDKGN